SASDVAAPQSRPRSCPARSYDRPAGERKEGQEERGRGEGDAQPEHDLDQLAESARRVAEGQREPRGDDDDDRDDARHRPLNRLQNGLQRAFPRHRGTGGLRRSGQEQQQRGQQQPLPRRAGQATQPREAGQVGKRIYGKTESMGVRHGSSPEWSGDGEESGGSSGNGVSSASAKR